MEPQTKPKGWLRDELVDLVQRELCGPYSEEEVLRDNPQSRYVCGQLAAVRKEDDEQLDDYLLEGDVLAGATDSDVSEPPLVSQDAEPDDSESEVESSSISRARRESLTSIGVSFAVSPGQQIQYEASWGEYEKDGEGRFKRLPRIATGNLRFDAPNELQTETHGRLSVRWVARRSGENLIASIFVVNVTSGSDRDGTERLYQVALVLACDQASAGFLPRDASRANRRRARLDVNDLLYRDRLEYGVGLHTSVRPVLTDAGSRCWKLETTAIPTFELRVTKARDFVAGSRALSMTWLADAREAADASAELRKLFADYRSWLSELEDRVSALPEGLHPHAEAQIERVADRIRRIDRGIEVLEQVPEAFEAFRFANEAMSRAQYRSTHRLPAGSPIDDSDRTGTWRPFQIAFLISSLPEIVFPEQSERRIVDILFFPTGGGKTEAYLGLSAFAMAFRRLSSKASNGGTGVSTVMRYTLRLLTTQQFSRAATLICAAESVRRERKFSNLGAHPFGIGLWVGPMTPNTFEDAKRALKLAAAEHLDCPRSCELSKRHGEFRPKALRGRETPNVLPITECPWCFSPICIECVVLDDNAQRVGIRCPNEACRFSNASDDSSPRVDGLPIHVVDEDVYRMCPTLVVATVDKFAILPFRGEAKSLFGKVSKYCEICGFLTDATPHKGAKHALSAVQPNAPADIVIQDELHTITDNLGSIYGLYETAIEFLLTRDGIGPKYVCATATVKDVARQIEGLYGYRHAEVFPPPGLDAGDTFFSSDIEPTGEDPGRKYVGIYAPTFSRLSTFVRVLGSILSAANHLIESSDENAADPYQTLLGYFNTVRDLGGVKALLGDDVQPVLEEIADRNGWKPRILSDWESELTGRISASEVPERLRTLNTPHRDGHGCDFMAATNMISVGVDVPRLGLMCVDGQPKTTSEYIQATSRVGRSAPGVVFVVYNSMRPRDVSHYEHFFSYHDSLYRFVEAGSITPFSDGSIARYLRAAIVACYRMSSKKSGNDSASQFGNDPDDSVPEIISTFQERASGFGRHESSSANSAIDELLEKWRTSPRDLVYYVSAPFSAGGSRQNQQRGLKYTVLRAADEISVPTIVPLFAAARSMRNVEAEVPLRVNLDG